MFYGLSGVSLYVPTTPSFYYVPTTPKTPSFCYVPTTPSFFYVPTTPSFCSGPTTPSFCYVPTTPSFCYVPTTPSFCYVPTTSSYSHGRLRVNNPASVILLEEREPLHGAFGLINTDRILLLRQLESGTECLERQQVPINPQLNDFSLFRVIFRSPLTKSIKSKLIKTTFYVPTTKRVW